MSTEKTNLGDICSASLLHTKWLLAPSHDVGHQWVETLVRDGGSVVNLRPTTTAQLALELVGSELAKDGLTLAIRSVGPLIVDATWNQLIPSGYLGRLQQSTDLSSAVFDSLLALRLAGFISSDIKSSQLESEAKAKDIRFLLDAYEKFLTMHHLVDEADVLGRAIARLVADPTAIGSDTLVLIPTGMRLAGLERQFVAALPVAARVEIRHPVERADFYCASTDIGLLAGIGKTVARLPPKNDGSVQLFRAVGEVNEVREVLRRAISDKQPLDEIELLHTDTETYVSLIYGTARRHFSEPDRLDGVPVTFAEGIPATMSGPGRALVAWLQWVSEDYPQRLLVEMIGEGLLDCGDHEGLSFGYLKSLFRPIAIGLGADQYLPKLDEQINAIGKVPPLATDGDDDNVQAIAAHQRKLTGLKALRKLTKELLGLSRDFSPGGSTMLEAAKKFLKTMASSVNELDRTSAAAIIGQLEDRRIWLEHLGVAIDLRKWIAALPSQTRVLHSGPRPGHLHVANVVSGGHSGRNRTFVVGLDDRRFRGAALQDPVLLDIERIRLSPELSTSADYLHQKVDELAMTLSRLRGSLTLSWSCLDLADDRENFPNSVLVSAYRLISGDHDADLDSLKEAIGPPVSFAPTAAEKALDESERWLWQLSRGEVRGTNQISAIEAFFPHLARGNAAKIMRTNGFGSFNGYVPQAGKDLNPFSTSKTSVLSASALETAGRCPLAFFFRHGLKLFPLDELKIDQDRWLDSAEFGSLMHEVFQKFMSDLSSAGKRPEFERDHTHLARIMHAVVEKWRNDVPPANESAFRRQYWEIVTTSRIFLQAEEEYCQSSMPRFFEVALGLERDGSESPLDERDPTSVTLPSGRTIRARGQIDRVDETGISHYSIWDYKISSGYGYEQAAPFHKGRRVQNILYLQMIETALRNKLDPKAVVERFGYFFPSIRAHGHRIGWDAATLSSGMEIVERLCASVEAGAFVATDNVDDCKYCDYASICRDTDHVTRHSKLLLQRDDLVPLENFRKLRND